MKVVRPRVTDPLAFLGLDGGLIFFSGFFFLVMHSNELLNFIHTKQKKICYESGQWSRAFTCSASWFLPSVFKIQLFPSRFVHYSEKGKWLHSSPATAPKCEAIKRVSFTSNYLTLICESGNALLFQRVSQSEAIICQSNASSTTFRNKRVNACLSTTKLL